MQEEIEALRQVSILRELTDEELINLRSLLSVRQCQPKERLLVEGQIVNEFSVVFSGTVHIRRLAGKREMLMGRLGPGGYFGEINLFDPGVATASIYVMKPTLLASITYDALRGFMAEHPRAGYKIVSAMITEMARRLRQTNARLVQSVYWASPSEGDV